MANQRINYKPADEVALTTQVGGVCPSCGKDLFYKKGNRSYKAYELAHIYPLNPTPEELILLDGVTKLHSDVNHPDNIIPLCKNCHGEYDKPRTLEGYLMLEGLKKKFIKQFQQLGIQQTYQLDEEIEKVIDSLYQVTTSHLLKENEFVIKKIADKFDETTPLILRRKIKHNISDYFMLIKKKFTEIEQNSPNSSVIIFSQVNIYYLNQKRLGLEQPEIFNNIVKWFLSKTNSETIEAAEIVTSFFIQNCEVFE